MLKRRIQGVFRASNDISNTQEGDYPIRIKRIKRHNEGRVLEKQNNGGQDNSPKRGDLRISERAHVFLLIHKAYRNGISRCEM